MFSRNSGPSDHKHVDTSVNDGLPELLGALWRESGCCGYTCFTYLSDAPERPPVVLGDARLSLLNEATGRFDLLVLDAFSSDTPPVHLLTVEAVADGDRYTAQLPIARLADGYYDLIAAFEERTGVPVLLNTSFNENEPIRCTPEEAVDTFVRTKMDLLVLGDLVVQKPAVAQP